jgi:hypothetical protein
MRRFIDKYWATITIAALVLALLSGCEAQICREIGREVDSFERCRADTKCMLSQDAYRKYEWGKQQQAIYGCES